MSEETKKSNNYTSEFKEGACTSYSGARFAKKGHSVLCQRNTVDCRDAGGRVTQEQLPKSTHG